MPADVVDFPDPSVMDDGINRFAVIFNIQPIAHIQTLAVHRKGLIGQRVDNHERNEFFREVIRTVVIRTPRNRDRQIIGAVIRKNE